MQTLLLHICCAPCSVHCVESLRDEGIEPAGFWYNPNIHPYQEYKARRDTLVDYAAAIGLDLTVREEYGLRGCGYWQIMQWFRANWLLLRDRFYIRKE